MRQIKKQIPIDEAIISRGFTATHATVYHRTAGHLGVNINAINDLIAAIAKKFIPGGGDYYGKGMYATGDKKSQFSVGGDKMMGYGNAVVEFLVDLKKILIFDYRLSSVVHPGKETLEDQLIRMVPSLTMANTPLIFQVLSEDLTRTASSSNRQVSADRCKYVWNDCLRLGKRLGHLYGADDSLMPQYYTAINDSSFAAAKAIAKGPNIHGVAFVGGNDGNVIVVYEKFVDTDTKMIQWCVSDPRFPTDETKLLVPWTPVGKGGSVQSMLVNKLAEVGIPRGRSSFDKVHIENSNTLGVAGCCDFVKSNFPWLGSPLVEYRALDIAFLSDKTCYITGGQWVKGTCPADYFGNEGEVTSQLKNAGKTVFQRNNAEIPIFHSGTFAGGKFTGVFNGGIFQKGVFEGLFKGGLIDLDTGARWGDSARLDVSEHTLTASIRYKGKLSTLPREVTNMRAFLKTVEAGFNTTTTQLPDASLRGAIERTMAFKADAVMIEDNWRGNKDITTAYNAFKGAYPWFFDKTRRQTWKDLPKIRITNDEIIVDRGVLFTGTVYYNVYKKPVIINGGIVNGNNTFEGVLQAGVYNRGTFKGTIHGGVLNLDQAIWDSSAAGKIDAGKPIKIICKKKYVDIIPETFLIPDSTGKKALYTTFGEVVKAIQTGAYQKIVVKLQKEIALAKRNKGPAPKLLRKINNYLKNLGINQVDDLGDDFADEEYSDDDIAQLLASVDNEHRAGMNLAELYECKRQAIWLAERKIAPENNWAPHEFFNEQEIAEVIENQIKNQKLELLDESVYNYDSLSNTEQQRLFDIFKDSYEKATGASFDQYAFEWRAAGWTFFDNPPDDKNSSGPVGGIAVRKQQSNGMIKLVASFGDFRSVLKGFAEFKSKYGSNPVWGIVTPEIQKLILKHDKSFAALPGVVIKALEGALKRLSGGEVKSVGLNGIIKVDTPAGIMDKVFLSNKAYINWLLDSISDPSNASRLPVPQKVLTPLTGIIQKLL
jgi:hypothetical protein